MGHVRSESKATPEWVSLRNLTQLCPLFSNSIDTGSILPAFPFSKSFLSLSLRQVPSCVWIFPIPLKTSKCFKYCILESIQAYSLCMIWLLPHPLPPYPVSIRSTGNTHRKTEKERQLANGREEGGVGGGARSYYSEKAWSSINHSNLSDIHCTVQRVHLNQFTSMFICALFSL
jgi:hypothetical protein